MGPWKKAPKCTLKPPEMVSIYQFEFKLQAVLLGQTKPVILPHLAMPMICSVFGWIDFRIFFVTSEKVNVTDIILSITECNIQSREGTSRAHRFKDDLKDYLLSDDGEMELTYMCGRLQALLILAP